jgi:hypothetical protein
MPNVCMHSQSWETLQPLKEEDLATLPINDTVERANALRNYYRENLSIWGKCTICGLVRINKQAYIDQICHVYGEYYRDWLFKKWSYHHDVWTESSYVYLIVENSPSLYKEIVFNSKAEATEALIQDIERHITRLKQFEEKLRAESSISGKELKHDV